MSGFVKGGHSPVPSLRLLFGTANKAGRTIIFPSPDFGGHSPVSSLRLLCGAAKKSDGRFSLCHDFSGRSPASLRKYCGRVIFFLLPLFCRNDERRCAPVPSLRLFFGTANQAGRTIIFSSPDFGRHSPVSLRKYCGRATVFHRGVFLPQR